VILRDLNTRAIRSFRAVTIASLNNYERLARYVGSSSTLVRRYATTR
jgi:hypothetical protein